MQCDEFNWDEETDPKQISLGTCDKGRISIYATVHHVTGLHAESSSTGRVSMNSSKLACSCGLDGLAGASTSNASNSLRAMERKKSICDWGSAGGGYVWSWCIARGK